ncbi:MAG: hypothetical protein WA895_22225, partial [Streptosporangiaceae bacterium]
MAVPVGGGKPESLTAWSGGISRHLPLADGRRVALIGKDEPAPGAVAPRPRDTPSIGGTAAGSTAGSAGGLRHDLQQVRLTGRAGSHGQLAFL